MVDPASLTIPVTSLQLAVLGDAQTGKTALLSQLCFGVFPKCYVPSDTGRVFRKQMQVSGHPYKLSVADVPSDDELAPLAQDFVAGADGVLVLYNIEDAHTFVSVLKHIRNAQRWAGYWVPVMLVGTHADGDARAISFEEAWELRKHLDCPSMEVSVASIDDVFECVGRWVSHVASVDPPQPQAAGVDWLFERRREDEVGMRAHPTHPLSAIQHRSPSPVKRRVVSGVAATTGNDDEASEVSDAPHHAGGGPE